MASLHAVKFEFECEIVSVFYFYWKKFLSIIENSANNSICGHFHSYLLNFQWQNGQKNYFYSSIATHCTEGISTLAWCLLWWNFIIDISKSVFVIHKSMQFDRMSGRNAHLILFLCFVNKQIATVVWLLRFQFMLILFVYCFSYKKLNASC